MSSSGKDDYKDIVILFLSGTGDVVVFSVTVLSTGWELYCMVL